MTFELDRLGACDRRVALRPEPFGALAYHFGTRRLSFLKTRKLLAVVQALDERADARAACEAAGVTARSCRRTARALATLVRMVVEDAVIARDDRAAGRPLRDRAGRADLPDLGADVRVQPGVRALPVELGAARSAGAVDRRVRGA